MTALSLTVNGERVEAAVEPRTHLADFLREACHLTGTHLGCEHGVCGACTVLLDGVPVRGCITLAVACEGAAVTSVEGFADDPLMIRLRQAFTRDHALQCGFCTPGMLIAAYDIVRRMPGASEAEIRNELAGNICRCTGYMGIVAAIRRVMSEEPAAIRQAAGIERRASASPLPLFTPVVAEEERTAPASASTAEAEDAPLPAGWTRVHEQFAVERPPAEVWPLLADVRRMAASMPGASVTSFDGHNVQGQLAVRLGPIRSAFAGTATVERDDARLMGRLSGAGGDATGSSAEGVVRYRLLPQPGGRATLVAVTMDYRLSGALAQFGRSGIVRDLIGRSVAQFAQNLARLAAGGTADEPAAPLEAGRLIRGALWRRVKAWLAALAGRRSTNHREQGKGPP
jgi:carbon-monoxide dehydrogenase small subunit